MINDFHLLKEYPVFRKKHFSPNYTRIRERGENRGSEWGGGLISQCSPFFGIIDIALVVLNKFKVAKPTTFPVEFDTKQAI